MSLSDLYVEYLRAPDSTAAAALSAALRDAQPFEAGLLEQYARRGAGVATVEGGAWQGHRAWIGPSLPPAQEAGQLWFDTAELTAMVLLPREPPREDWHPDAIRRWTPFEGWLSLRPVSVWQYRAYLELSGVTRRRIEPIDFTTNDPARILNDDDETLPVTRLTCAEAKGFANWMGKQLPGQETWQAARRMLPNAIDVLWNSLRKEWIGYPEQEEDEALAISVLTMDGEVSEEHDLDEPPPAAQRMIYRYYDWSKYFGFRTAIYAEIGLFTDRSIGPLYGR